MATDIEPTTAESATNRRELSTEAPDRVQNVAKRFAQTYDLSKVDRDFEQLFAPTVEVWHNFDQDIMKLSGDEIAGAMLRMLRATADIMQGHSDQIWSLEVSQDSFTLAATASGELNGNPVRISRCLLVTVHEGRITSICEFGDRQQRAPLDAALRAANMFRT